jgi:hypothetical protein
VRAACERSHLDASAPKARQTISLGREPQGNDMNKLRAAKRRQTIKGPSVADAAAICRPFRAPGFCCARFLGLLTACGRRDAHSPGCGRCRTRCRDSGSTRSPAERGFTPQAMNLPPLRGWAFGVLATGPWLIGV